MNNVENAIEIKELTKIFGNNRGIKNINFDIKKGSFHVLIGPNGSGKTTIIRCLLRVYKEYGGGVAINGIKTTKKIAFSGVGYISEVALFPAGLSAQDVLLWYGKIAGRDENEIRAEIQRYASSFGIGHILDKRPTNFSSGQKQKVMLIKVLIEKADIIIMDEPTSNLDPSARILFFDEIAKLNNDGRTILICSHNLEEVEKKVDWVTVIKDGELMYSSAKTKTTLSNIFRKFAYDGGVE